MRPASLVQLSDKYKHYATVYACLVLFGALLLGWNAGATVTCPASNPDGLLLACEKDVQAWTFLIVSATYALGGLIVVLPVYGLAHVMRALAVLLPDQPSGHRPARSPSPRRWPPRSRCPTSTHPRPGPFSRRSPPLASSLTPG